MTDKETEVQQDLTEQQEPQKNESRHLIFVAFILALLVFWGIQHPRAAHQIVLVLVGFGGIVMIHELGHFIVAKLGGIKIEAFSIGMPPVVLGIRKLKKGWRVRVLPKPGESVQIEEGDNDTEYQIGLFPIGGFVKMLGQSDTGAVDAVDDPRSYANRPIGVRIATVSAGVIFNAIGAIVIFIILFMNGIDLPSGVVGHVIHNSPAYDAGIRAGDEIIEVNGDYSVVEGQHRVDFEAVSLAPALSSPGEPVSYLVRHSDGTEEEINVIAETPAEDTSKLRYSGISQGKILTVDWRVEKDPNGMMELFDITGLRPRDEIKAVNDQSVQSWWEFEDVLSRTFQPEVTLRVSRQWPFDPENNQRTMETVKLPMWIAPTVENFRDEYDLTHFCSLVPRIRVEGIPASPKIAGLPKRIINGFRKKILRQQLDNRVDNDQMSLKAGDILIKIADVEYPNYKQLRDLTTSHDDKDMPITVLRKDAQGIEQKVELSVHPKMNRASDRVMIGFNPGLDIEHPIVAQTLPSLGTAGGVSAIPAGATILAIADKPVRDFFDIATAFQKNTGQTVRVDYQLDEKTGNVSVAVPEFEPVHAEASLAVAGIPFEELTV
ncbi:MAG: site-2 protease family protein, partial [Phycisphaerae bacterium]|nr:site-2 protease family protein [Phycisphaerae bacterium]